jgi:Flp pilus assembly protein TadG
MLKKALEWQRGGALVEFAMVAPVLFMFLIGSLEFGFLLYEFHATDYAAKSAARWASVHGANCTNSSGSPTWTQCPTKSDGSYVTSFVTNSIPGLQASGSKFKVATSWTAPPTASYPQGGGASLTCSGAAQASGCLVTVTVTNPVTVHIPLIKNTLFNITSSSTAVVQ